MSQPVRFAVCLAVALILWCANASAAVSAVPGGEIAGLDREPTRSSTFQSNGMSLSQAVEQVRRQYGGRIISAETRRSGNREVHHIKVLTRDNKVKTVKINGRRL